MHICKSHPIVPYKIVNKIQNGSYVIVASHIMFCSLDTHDTILLDVLLRCTNYNESE